MYALLMWILAAMAAKQAAAGASNYALSATFPLVGASGDAPNLLFFGNPFGARRPASARLPRQSASSLSDSVKTRPAESIQVRPSAALNVLTSQRPPSL